MRRLLSFAVVLVLLTAGRTSAAQSQPTDLYDNPPGTGCWMQASDGNLYQQGYKFDLTTLAAPTAFPLPSCSFFQGTDASFYSWSGSAITKVTLGGVASTVHTFTNTDGYSLTALIEGNDGNFYGTASGGGAYGYGTLFMFTPSGTFIKLYDFTDGPDGAYPQSLVQASDGKLYGTTQQTTFSATLAGQVTTIANVGNTSLIEDASGLLYGDYDGNFDSISLTGNLTFVADASTLGLENSIFGPCFLDGSGNFDCSTSVLDEAYNSNLNLLDISPSGGGGTFYQFSYPNIENGGAGGTYSLAGDGMFYGTFGAGGNSSPCGDECPPVSVSYIYSLVPQTAPIPIQISFSPSAVAPNQSVTLTWQVNNAYSDTMAQCFASGGWSGLKSISGTAGITAPTAPGNYRYALTCDGIETAAANLAVGMPLITLSASPTTFVTGSTVTLTAHVTGTTSGTPTGKVTFMDGLLVVGSAALNGSGAATLTLPTKGVAAGNYAVTATYSGSNLYAAATSSPVSLKVLGTKHASFVNLTISPMPVQSGAPITLSATVSEDGSLLPTGSVTFYSNKLVLGKGTLTGDSNSVSITLPTAGVPAGSYPVTAAYSGDAAWTPSTSNTGTATIISLLTPTVTLTASPNPVAPPAQVTLTSTVAGVSGQPAPTGTVYFYLGQTYLGADSLNGSGVASFSTATTGDSAGTYAISATYLGDSNYLKTSATSSVTVQ